MSELTVDRIMAAFTILMVILGLSTVGWVVASLSREIVREVKRIRARRRRIKVRENPMFGRDYKGRT